MNTSKLQSSPGATMKFSQIINRPRSVTPRPVLWKTSGTVVSPDYKPEVDLRAEINRFNIPIRFQGSRATCSVFAVAFLLEFMYAKHFGMKNPDLSEEFLNYATNYATGERADGGFFDDIDMGYQKFGCVNEAIAPYRNLFDPYINYDSATKALAAELMPRLKPHFIKQWNISTGLLASQLLAIVFHLKSGRPVAAGLRWPKDGKFKVETFEGVSMMTSPAATDVIDGHSIVFVGYKVSDKFPGGGYLVFRNHWGEQFMDNGYGYMSFDYASRYTNDLVQYGLPR